jgi:hypothetical protein
MKLKTIDWLPVAFDGRALSAPFTAKTHRLPVAMIASTRYQESTEDQTKNLMQGKIGDGD